MSVMVALVLIMGYHIFLIAPIYLFIHQYFLKRRKTNGRMENTEFMAHGFAPTNGCDRTHINAANHTGMGMRVP
jgi:hypothetical protein